MGSSLNISLVYYFNFHLIRTRGTAALIGYLNVRKLAIENWSTTHRRLGTHDDFPLEARINKYILKVGCMDAWIVHPPYGKVSLFEIADCDLEKMK